ncbi:hypothetical protein SCHPADRAFT_328745 [Schizopora paradoxa]|uniref:F-box domain-containing protein n=1 Tax=Schizopora paradoxa TaxID=27342 RepID=A0A0H2RXC3_9AGAM|nr:hypothetical protein SCHPADRAFT_328745 [Schizopora paradoxa]
MRWFSVLSRTGRHRASATQRTVSFDNTDAVKSQTPSPVIGTIFGNEHQRSAPFPQSQASSPFRSLPFDIFASILELAISVESDFFPEYDIRGLFVVSAVCRYWRWAVLATPSFWAYIPSYLPLDILEVFLRRSDGALLHVVLLYNFTFSDIPNPYTSNIDLLRKENIFLAKLDCILSHSHWHRIRFLFLSLSATAWTSAEVNSRLAVSLRSAQCRMPALEGLCFISNAHPSWSPPSGQNVRDAELSIFTNLRSPVLRELHLGLITLPLSCITASSLSKLSLALGNQYAVIDPEKYLREILKGAPRLRFLSLDLYAVGNEFKAGRGSIDSVSLPELRQLKMRGGTCSIYSSVYAILLVPSLEEICVETVHSVDHATDFIPSLPPGDRLRVTIDKFTIKLEFEESRNLGHGARNQFLYTPLSRFGPNSVNTNNELLLSLLRSRHFPRIASVEFSTSYHFDSTFMLQLLSHFEALRKLSMSFTNTESILCIEDAMDLNTLQSPSSPLAPLQLLSFRNLSVVMPQASPFIVGLCAIVRGRSGNGLQPLAVDFKECSGVTDSLLRTSGLGDYTAVRRYRANRNGGGL